MQFLLSLDLGSGLLPLSDNVCFPSISTARSIASVDVALYPSWISTNSHFSGSMKIGESAEGGDCNLDIGQHFPVVMIGEFPGDGDLFCFVGVIDSVDICLVAATQQLLFYFMKK